MKSDIYVQKILILGLAGISGLLLYPFITPYLLLPALLFVLAFLISRITGQKPDYLYGLARADELMNARSPVWYPLKWFVLLAGLIYDILAWILYGAYMVYSFVLDFILLIKNIIYWILFALIWTLKQFVPPFIYLFKISIYYLFRWSWWIYKVAFRNIKKSLNLNFYFIAAWGSFFMLFVLLLFYGLGKMAGIPEIGIIGLAFAVLPVIWSYGEISAIRFRNAENEPYRITRKNFSGGFDALRAVLKYFIYFLGFILIEVFLNLGGWIPDAGFTLMGIALNINTFISIILVFIFVILIFSKLILPAHVVYNPEFSAGFSSTLSFLEVIGKRFLRYLISFLPSAFFGLIISLVPGIIVTVSVLLTLNLRNSILDSRIETLKSRLAIYEGEEQYKCAGEISRIEFFRNYPVNLMKDPVEFTDILQDISLLKKNIVKGEEEIAGLTEEFSASVDSMDKRLSLLKNKPMGGEENQRETSALEKLRQEKLESFSIWKEESEQGISRMKLELDSRKEFLIQLPLVMILTIIWLAIIISLPLAFLISYLGNLYFELYQLKEDGQPLYLQKVADELNKKDRNQPLLGFSLLFLVLILWLGFRYYNELVRFFDV